MPAALLDREIWLRADPASAGVARAFVADAAESLRSDRATVLDLQLATTEAVANAVQHGHPCHNDLISISVSTQAGCLVTQVEDCGDFHVARRADNGLHERGRGLQLMFAVMDHVEIDSIPGRTAVRLVKRLPA